MDIALLPDRPFTNRDLAELGLTPKRLRLLVEQGLVRRVVRGVYVPAALEDTVELRAQSVALVVAPDHVVRDRTAAWIHGVRTLTYGELDMLPPVEVCALRNAEPSGRRGVDACTRDLASYDVVVVDDLRVTTPLRTALDLGCVLRRREAKAALDAFARRFGITSAAMATESVRYRRRRGVVQLRELIPLVDPRIESARESWTHLAIHDAGLPLPVPQLWIEIDGSPTYRLDFAYPRRRVAVEYDGFDAHERTPQQRAADRHRRQWLRDHGWTVIVIRRGDFTGEGLEKWLRELREALAPSYSNVRRMERGSRLAGC